MRIVVIGATGHIGTYLVPRLVTAGHEVIALSRGQRRPYQPNPAWASVQQVTVDRQAEEKAGRFARQVASFDADVVVDLICFTLDSARHLAEGLEGTGTFLAHCGTLWVHGAAVEVPITEEAIRRPFGAYGIAKAEIEAFLLGLARRGRLRTTVLHPGHIVGPGWPAINPRCLLDLDTFGRLATNQEVVLPDQGLAQLHHVHADDVAQAFQRVIERQGVANGEAFHVVSEAALTLQGYAESAASWFGQTAKLTYLPWDQWQAELTDEETETAWSHVAHSPCASIAKAQRLLGYTPRWTSLDAIREAVSWQVATGTLDTSGRLPA